jgi:hypothetical protein
MVLGVVDMHQEIDWPLLFAGLALASFALCQMAGGRVAVILERAAIAAFFLITAANKSPISYS